MNSLNYPDPKHAPYLVFEFDDQVEEEFKNMKWRFKELNEYYKDKKRQGRSPFTVTLSELMKMVVK